MYRIGPKTTCNREHKSNSGSIKETKISVKIWIVRNIKETHSHLGTWNRAKMRRKLSYKVKLYQNYAVKLRLLLVYHKF